MTPISIRSGEKLALLLMFCTAGAVRGSWHQDSVPSSPSCKAGGLLEIPPFAENLYAQLLMNATSGSLYPADAYDPQEVYYMQKRGASSVPSIPYSQGARELGQDWPSIGHTMIGHRRLEGLYEALRTCHNHAVPGDIVEAGVWRGGASIFAAGILKQARSDRHVYVCDSFAGECARKHVHLHVSACLSACS